jgi:hypothetical protein
MCEIRENFMLCSCGTIEYRDTTSVHGANNSNSNADNAEKKQPDLVLIWTLEHASMNEITRVGEMRLGYPKIAVPMNERFVIEQLNSRNCFDFKYDAVEGDEITFKTNEIKSAAVSFVFQNRKWRQGTHGTMNYTFNEIASGILENK